MVTCQWIATEWCRLRDQDDIRGASVSSMLDLCLVIDCMLSGSIQQYSKLLLTIDEIVRAWYAFNPVGHGWLLGSFTKTVSKMSEILGQKKPTSHQTAPDDIRELHCPSIR